MVGAYILDVTATNSTEVTSDTTSNSSITLMQGGHSHMTYVGIAVAVSSVFGLFIASVGVIILRYMKIVSTHTGHPNANVTLMRSCEHSNSIPNGNGLSSTLSIYTEDMTSDVVDGSYVQGVVELESDSHETLSLAETVCIYEDD
jgi:hypothetical protein